jgi:hypothetical protein
MGGTEKESRRPEFLVLKRLPGLERPIFMRICLGLFLLFTSLTFAQMTEAAVSLGVSRLSNAAIGSSGSIPISLDNGFRLGFRLTLNPKLFFGHEIGYAYSRTGFVTTPPQGGLGTAIHQGTYAFLAYATKEGSRIRPFAAGGAHFSNYAYPGFSALSGGGQSKFGFNYGAGVKIRVGEIFMIRFDGRQYMTPKPFGFPGSSGLLRQNEISAGFGLAL